MNPMKIAATLFLLIWHIPAWAADWWQLEKATFPGTDRKPVSARVLVVDGKNARISIVSVPFEQKSQPGLTETSLRAFSEHLARRHEKFRNREWIAVNGGFSSYRADVPLGLLVVDGAVYSRLSREKSRPAAASSGANRRYRWSGILCQPRGRDDWRLLATAQYEPGSCDQALQGGPFLVEGGRVVVSPSEPGSRSPFTRTVVCLGADGDIRFVVTTDPTHLYPMAQWLVRSPARGGVGCTAALNLSGDTSSGMVIRSPRDTNPTYIGAGSFPLPTVLVIEPR